MSIYLRRILFAVLVVPLLLPVSVRANRARHGIGAQFRSNFGQFTDTQNWQIQAPVSSTINGVSVNTSIVCPPSQGVDNNGSTVITGPPPTSQQICIAGRYLFVYEIPSPPNNSVYTFGGLTGFSFNVFRLLRLDRTGALVSTFREPTLHIERDTPFWLVNVVPVLDGTKDLYIGGTFTTYDDVPVNHIARIHADGSLASGVD